jgi:hypothetical protein
MSSVLPDHLDRLKALIEGTESVYANRTIPARRFKHVESAVEDCLAAAAAAPYPASIEDLEEFQPNDLPTTTSAEQVWSGARFRLRVGYAGTKNEVRDLQEIIARDGYALRRTLGDPGSWDGVTGFSRVVAYAWRTIETAVPGEDGERDDTMTVLEMPIELAYREDQTT